MCSARRNADWLIRWSALCRHAVHAPWLYRARTPDNVLLINTARAADPLLGVMLTPDPVLGVLGNPQSLSRYAYVTNNPASLTDPDGFLFGRIGKFFKRGIRGIGSLARRTVRNYGREIAAAVAAYYTAGLVSETYMAATPGASLATGDTLGAMAGGAVAGGVSTGDIRGVAVGAAGGAAFGAMGATWGDTWNGERVLTSGLVGGALAEANGGDFRQGFMFAGGAAGFAWGYQEIVDYGATWDSGGEAQGKGRYTMPGKDINNFGRGPDRLIRVHSGMKVEIQSRHEPGSRHERYRRNARCLSGAPGQFGGSHFGSHTAGRLNVPGMPLLRTYPVLLQGVPAVMMATDEIEEFIHAQT
jgi:RHS repeat-associated protein